jgi:hypothetical protein
MCTLRLSCLFMNIFSLVRRRFSGTKNGDKMRRKKLEVPVIVIVVFISTISYAGTYEVELNASKSPIEARFDYKRVVEHGSLTTGIGAIYSEDEYRIGYAKLTLGNELLLAGLRLHLGFKGALGEVENDSREADLMAIGLLFSGSYTIPETILPLPIDLSMSFSMAPDPLSFLDSDQYMDFRASLDFNIVKNAAIIFGYRYIEADLSHERGDWELSDETLFIGYQLRF